MPALYRYSLLIGAQVYVDESLEEFFQKFFYLMLLFALLFKAYLTARLTLPQGAGESVLCRYGQIKRKK